MCIVGVSIIIRINTDEFLAFYARCRLKQAAIPMPARENRRATKKAE